MNKMSLMRMNREVDKIIVCVKIIPWHSKGKSAKYMAKQGA